VIGAQAPLKIVGKHGERTYNAGPRPGTDGLLAKVNHVGTVVLLLSRTAKNALTEDASAETRMSIWMFSGQESKMAYTCQRISRYGTNCVNLDSIFMWTSESNPHTTVCTRSDCVPEPSGNEVLRAKISV
jgi:hypothetical protein